MSKYTVGTVMLMILLLGCAKREMETGAFPISPPLRFIVPHTQHDLVGNWRVEGTNPDGGTYQGRLTVEQHGENGYRLLWVMGNALEGVGILMDGVMAAGWGGGDHSHVAIYQRQGDGRLMGMLLGRDEPRPGGEIAFPVAKGPDFAGTYQVLGRRPDASEYRAELQIQQDGPERYLLSWRGTDEVRRGVAMMVEDHLAVGWGHGNNGVTVYRWDGENLKGTWTRMGIRGMGEEHTRGRINPE